MKQLLILFTVLTTLFSQQMVSIPGGTFTLGGGTESDEKPAVEVTIQPFQMDVTPVTNAQYNRCAGCAAPHYSDSTCYLWNNSGLKKTKVPEHFSEPNRPVVCVSWYQARKYCQSVGKRLPSEAEWEFAATNGGAQKYSWGNSSPSTDNSYFRQRSTHDVSSKPAGAYGLRDINGTVWEWINGRYERDLYKYIDPSNPRGPSVGRFRSIRGGGWYSSPNQINSRNRHWFAPEAGEVSIGFRCVK